MKKTISILTIIFFTGILFAQSPERMSYQAVVRNSANVLVTAAPVTMRISIVQGSVSGTTVYSETHTSTANDNGLVSLQIGGGTVIQGDFSTINWANGPYFIKTETDPQGGTNYSITGISQLMSVPYALYAETSGTAGPQGPAGVDGLLPNGTDPGNTPYWDGTEWVTGSSNIHNNGGNIGIGTTNPTSRLHVNGDATISGEAIADAFVKDGGTAFQFLKADGSIDNNMYLTSGQQGVTQLASISNIPNANGATINGTTLMLQPASTDFGGIVTTGTQTFAGEKYFNSPIQSQGTMTVGNDFSGEGRIRVLSNNNSFSDPIGTQLYVRSYVKSWVGAPGDTMPLYSAADIDASILGFGDPVMFIDATALQLKAPYGSGYINSWALKTDGSVKVNGSLNTTAPATIGQVTYTNSDGSSGQVLTTDGNGATSWQTFTGATGPQGPAGADGVIANGSAAGNTSYWDGSNWITNSNNLYNNGNNIGIGTTNPQEKLEINGNASASTFISTASTGTSPLTVASTTKVTNLNSDYLDGLNSTDLLQGSNDLADLSSASAARTNLGLGSGNSPSFTGITITGGSPAQGNVLVSDASGNASWQDQSLKTVDGNPFVMLNSSYSGKIITTQWGGQPSFPENLPDGFTCEIINYSNAPYTSNTLSTTFFFNRTNGWNNGNGANSLSIPSGGTVRISVATVNGIKGYFVTGDFN